MKAKSILHTLILFTISTAAVAGSNISMVIGTYTGSGSKGIYAFSFNQDTGKAILQNTLELVNPSYLTFSKNGKLIYAVSEQSNSQASLNAISYNKKNGKMVLLNTEATNGEDPCYVEVSKDFALTANYGGGNMSYFPLLSKGKLGANSALFKGNSNPNDADRQQQPHVHCAKIAPDGYIFATDFSGDQILSYAFDKSQKELVSRGVAAKIEDNSGPRHLVFSKKGTHVYVISELSGKVTVFDYANGKLRLLQTIVSDDEHARGAADIHLSPDGQFLYTSNRLKSDGVAIFKVGNDGKLTRVGYQLTGIHPRNFAITPNGKYLLVACRDDDKIQVFLRNQATGLLEDTHQDIQMNKPVCVKFAPTYE